MELPTDSLVVRLEFLPGTADINTISAQIAEHLQDVFSLTSRIAKVGSTVSFRCLRINSTPDEEIKQQIDAYISRYNLQIQTATVASLDDD
ncbi:hypothetical protein H6770_05835 [Candidatus Peribacteria bacterium]|nr:hypothetical protein [Candidatus Peribacteria bacterium]